MCENFGNGIVCSVKVRSIEIRGVVRGWDAAVMNKNEEIAGRYLCYNWVMFCQQFYLAQVNPQVDVGRKE